mmetsp:Transcript_27734/g.38737  ORF Transcript_27734/g.38737 Transcript_27734/m.38737 type:complete len:178 (-) Transcript_27734:295-828(-)
MFHFLSKFYELHHEVIYMKIVICHLSYNVEGDHIDDAEYQAVNSLTDAKITRIFNMETEEEKKAAWRELLGLEDGDEDAPLEIREFEYQVNRYPQGWFHYKISSKKALSKHMRFYANADSVLTLFKAKEWKYVCYDVRKEKMPHPSDMECATPTFGVYFIHKKDPSCVIKMSSITSR